MLIILIIKKLFINLNLIEEDLGKIVLVGKRIIFYKTKIYN